MQEILITIFNVWVVTALFNGIFFIRHPEIIETLSEQDGLKEHDSKHIEFILHATSAICAPLVTGLIVYTYIKIYLLIIYRMLLLRLIILLTKDKKTKAEFRQILKDIRFNDRGEKKEIIVDEIIDETKEDEEVQ